jgi:hypothetical protein
MNLLPVTMGRAFLPLHHFTDPFIFCESPRGCLKTCSILNSLMARAGRWPGSRWYLWRSTRTRLSDTVLRSFEEYVIPAWSEVRGMRLMNPHAGPSHRSSYVFENGSEFIPVGLDDIQRGTSAEGAGGYLAEAIELDRPDQALALAGMLRQPGVPFHQIIVDANPGAPGHWLNQIAESIDPKLRRVETQADYLRLQEYNQTPAVDPLSRWKRIVAKIQDNPHYFDVGAWKYTDAGESYLKTLGVLKGHLRRRWIDGDWISAEGSVYPEFDEHRHVMTPFRIPKEWPQYVGLDPGYDHPCAILWFAVAPNGCVYVVDELYRGGLSVVDHARDIRLRNAGRTVQRYYADPQHAFSRTAQSPRSIAAQLKDCGLTFVPWPRTGGNEETMVEAVRKRLISDRLKVFATCVNTIREFQSWSYKRTATGELPAGEDKFEDRDNHTMDCVKGVLATNPKPLKPAGTPGGMNA